MANYTKTITNTVRVWGPEPTEKWSSAPASDHLRWGFDNWAYGTAGLPVTVYKPFADTITLSDALDKRPFKALYSTQTMTMGLGKEFEKYLPATMSAYSRIELGWVIYNELISDSAVSLGFYRAFGNDMTMTNSIHVAKYRGVWAMLGGDSDNVVEWPRDSMSKQITSACTWTMQTTAGQTWSATT